MLDRRPTHRQHRTGAVGGDGLDLCGTWHLSRTRGIPHRATAGRGPDAAGTGTVAPAPLSEGDAVDAHGHGVSSTDGRQRAAGNRGRLGLGQAVPEDRALDRLGSAGNGGRGAGLSTLGDGPVRIHRSRVVRHSSTPQPASVSLQLGAGRLVADRDVRDHRLDGSEVYRPSLPRRVVAGRPGGPGRDRWGRVGRSATVCPAHARASVPGLVAGAVARRAAGRAPDVSAMARGNLSASRRVRSGALFHGPAGSPGHLCPRIAWPNAPPAGRGDRRFGLGVPQPPEPFRRDRLAVARRGGRSGHLCVGLVDRLCLFLWTACRRRGRRPDQAAVADPPAMQRCRCCRCGRPVGRRLVAADGQRQTGGADGSSPVDRRRFDDVPGPKRLPVSRQVRPRPRRHDLCETVLAGPSSGRRGHPRDLLADRRSAHLVRVAGPVVLLVGADGRLLVQP